MDWKIKASIQNVISALPSSASYEAYYWVQRHFGNLRTIDPTSRLTAGIETWQRIQANGSDPANKVFFEVGTGRVPLVPLAYWLMGAAQTITVDLNPYLKEELVNESLSYISHNREKVRNLFGSLLDQARFSKLLSLYETTSFSTKAFLDLCKIVYVAPGDAARTGLAAESVDFHTSFTVFEHIPPDVLVSILKEGNRIVRPSGMFINRIDYSDHFAHSDTTISKINFLQYSNDEWDHFAGNRYMYMNRLRHDDFLEIFSQVGHKILETTLDTDQRSEMILASGGLQLNPRFRTKSLTTLAIIGSWIVSRKQP